MRSRGSDAARFLAVVDEQRILQAESSLRELLAVADLRGLRLRGFPAWFLWKTVYMLKLPTLASRLRVVLDWTVELFFERDVSELTVGGRDVV